MLQLWLPDNDFELQELLCLLSYNTRSVGMLLCTFPWSAEVHVEHPLLVCPLQSKLQLSKAFSFRDVLKWHLTSYTDPLCQLNWCMWHVKTKVLIPQPMVKKRWITRWINIWCKCIWLFYNRRAIYSNSSKHWSLACDPYTWVAKVSFLVAKTLFHLPWWPKWLHLRSNGWSCLLLFNSWSWREFLFKCDLDKFCNIISVCRCV